MSTIVSILMGSKSDWPIMEHAHQILDQFSIPHESRILSAHRTPEALQSYIKEAEKKGVNIFIAGAGGAAHLPGVIASQTVMPVIGVPIQTQALNGMDSLFSIVQMPSGIPVATMAVGKAGAINAGLLAVSILACRHAHYREALQHYRETQATKLLEQSNPLEV
ncbi:MAG: 5-(carboxyamino)imidazole ribonucleotide mutase [Gammaproteobacteria bacterium]|nr:5-(carboxyamino)imidazole ribonucleotide mutase [Gammaproteobacteria bacterium]